MAIANSKAAKGAMVTYGSRSPKSTVECSAAFAAFETRQLHKPSTDETQRRQ
jgi:hypothetical protein